VSNELCPRCHEEWTGTSCGIDNCGWTWETIDEPPMKCSECGKDFRPATGTVIGYGYVICPECAKEDG
jgi:hypothetical protein